MTNSAPELPPRLKDAVEAASKQLKEAVEAKELDDSEKADQLEELLEDVPVTAMTADQKGKLKKAAEEALKTPQLDETDKETLTELTNAPTTHVVRVRHTISWEQFKALQKKRETDSVVLSDSGNMKKVELEMDRRMGVCVRSEDSKM